MPKKRKADAHAAPPGGKNKAGQTRGQNERDPKGRRGQYGGAGDAPLIKK
jgi:hypothetical protein